ncbi:hypothetical protein MMPV_007431 [Pyropia vietnamensis]
MSLRRNRGRRWDAYDDDDGGYGGSFPFDDDEAEGDGYVPPPDALDDRTPPGMAEQLADPALAEEDALAWTGHLRNVGTWSARRQLLSPRGDVLASVRTRVITSVDHGRGAGDDLAAVTWTTVVLDGDDDGGGAAARRRRGAGRWGGGGRAAGFPSPPPPPPSQRRRRLVTRATRGALRGRASLCADGSFADAPPAVGGQRHVITLGIVDAELRAVVALAYEWDGVFSGVTVSRERRGSSLRSGGAVDTAAEAEAEEEAAAAAAATAEADAAAGGRVDTGGPGLVRNAVAELAELEGTWRGSGVLLRARDVHRQAVESVTRFTRRPFGGVEVAGRVTLSDAYGDGRGVGRGGRVGNRADGRRRDAPPRARRSPDWWEAEEEERSLVPATARLDGRMLFFGPERLVTLLAGGGVSITAPVVIGDGRPFVVEAAYLVSPDLRKRVLRAYAADGGWAHSTFLNERLMS